MKKSAILNAGKAKESIPKGCVPLIVGNEAVERVFVNVKLLKDPCISLLLEKTAQDIGFEQEGMLKLPCDVEHFRWIVREAGKGKKV